MESDLERAQAPFLTVIMRTQGKRPEALEEVLLCLSAQTCVDFEVLLIGHRLDDAGREVVSDILDNLTDTFRNKVCFLEVEDGNRTKPLNVGLRKARGRYISVLDDDDLVFDNWVEAFYEIAPESNDAVLHTFVISQNWEMVKNADGENLLRASGSPGRVYCKTFDFFSQLIGNKCPVMSLAFPRDVIDAHSICFDESLTTVEDWDFLMRVAAICEVKDNPTPTSIYRLWENVENSYSIYDEEEWKNNCLYVRRKLNEKTLVFKPGFVDKIINLQWENSHYSQACLYVDDGKGMAENKTLKAKADETGVYDIVFDNFSEYLNVVQLRFDPCDRGMVSLDKLKICILLKDGSREMRDINDITSNGIRIRDEIAFWRNDPQIYIAFQEPKAIEKVKISYSTFDTTDQIAEMCWHRYFASKKISTRVMKKGKRVKNRIKRTLIRGE